MKNVGRGRRDRAYLGYYHLVVHGGTEWQKSGTDNPGRPDIRRYLPTLEKRMQDYKPKGYLSILRKQRSDHGYPP